MLTNISSDHGHFNTIHAAQSKKVASVTASTTVMFGSSKLKFFHRILT